VGPRAGLGDLENRKFLTLPGLELQPSVVQPIASRYTDCAIPAPIRKKKYSSSLSLRMDCATCYATVKLEFGMTLLKL
jgi:hypothetical protein